MKIRVTLSDSGINEALRQLEDYSRKLQDKADKLTKELAAIGLEVARVGFAEAQYDGTNDVSVTVEDKGKGYKAVVATGQAVLFIEFGTGVTYADNHPQKPDGIVGRGEYGKGHGSRRTWGYYGEPGTSGTVIDRGGKQVVLTHGNPANMSMFNAKERMRQDIERVAREVFASA